MTSLGQSACYDVALDAFIIVDDKEQEEFGAVELEGRKLYPIGFGTWIWEEAETGANS